MFTIIGGDGKEYGPASIDQIRAWIAGGRANLDTQARRMGETEWRRLGDFTEFAPPGTTPPPLVTPAEATPAETSIDTVEPPLASRWLRLAAAFIDGLLVWICRLPTIIATMQVLQAEMMSGQQPSVETIMHVTQASFMKTVPWLLALALVQCVLIATRGQSIGKILCKLRIVRHPDGAPSGFVHAVALRSVVPTIIEQIPLLGGIFWIVDSCFIFGDEKRCIHDYIGGTKVVTAL